METNNDEEKYKPLKEANFLLFLCFMGSVLTLLIYRINTGRNLLAEIGIFLGSFILLIFVISTVDIGLKTPNKCFNLKIYILRNILGYYKIFWWKVVFDEQTKNHRVEEKNSYVSRLDLWSLLEGLDFENDNCNLILAIPFGGWFSGIKFLSMVGMDRWKISTTSHSHSDIPDNWSVTISDSVGSKVRLTIKELGVLLPTLYTFSSLSVSLIMLVQKNIKRKEAITALETEITKLKTKLKQSENKKIRPFRNPKWPTDDKNGRGYRGYRWYLV